MYEADHSTQVRLRDYVVSHVFTDLEEDEPEEEDGNRDVPLTCSALSHIQLFILLSVRIVFSSVTNSCQCSKCDQDRVILMCSVTS